MLRRARAFLPVLAIVALWSLVNSAQAQSTNSDPCGNGSTASGDEKYIGVCNLENTVNGIAGTPFAYSDSYPIQGDIPFSIRSCGTGGYFQSNCAEAVAYRVAVQGSAVNSNQFLLSDPGSGGTLPVHLSFSRAGGGTQQLIPNQLSSATFAGSVAQIAAALTVAVSAPDPSLLPGSYSGDFYFTLEQTQHCKWFLVFPNCTDTYLLPIPFRVSVEVASKIRISGLSDMAITANPSGLTEAQQEFCVYSQGGASFGITATSVNGSGSFLLAGNLDQIEYETWVQSLTVGGLLQLTEGQPTSQLWPGTLWDQCTGGSGENMQLSIRIQPAALANALESSYSDTLTLTVELD